MSPGVPSGRYLPTLDGWRAVAISMVLLSHAFTVDSAKNGGGRLIELLTFRLGTLGVMLFFAISGFLICTRLLVEEDSSGSISLRSFYIRRVFRIIPAAYLYLTVIGVLSLAGIAPTPWRDIAAAGLFVSNYVVASAWFTGHFWSLALEEHFYLLWPPLLKFSGRRVAGWGAVVLIGVTVVLRHYTVASLPGGTDLPGYTQLRLDAFMFPCILAILLREPTLAQRFRRAMTPLVWLGVAGVMAAGIAVGTVVPGWREPQRLLQALVLPILIAATVFRPEDLIGRLLQARPLRWLGLASYSVYLWQQLVFGFAPATLRARVIWSPVFIGSILLLAELSRRWIEVPMIAIGRRFATEHRDGSVVR